MLTENKQEILDQIITDFSKEEILWIGGYLSGAALKGMEIPTGITGSEFAAKITVIYVSETGNAKFLAAKVAAILKNQGGQIKVKSSEQYRLIDLKKEKNMIFITSTHGEGEVPEQGKALFDYIKNEDLDLKDLNYFVIGLGDKNYPLFCQAAKDFDELLISKKAKRLAKVAEFDLDFESYIEELSEKSKSLFSGEKNVTKEVEFAKKTNKNEFIGEIVQNIDLNDGGSTKETRHVEIVCDDEINYEPGDSVGVLLAGEDIGLKKEEKITPRLYSIASCKLEHGNEIHLTVSVLRYKNEKGEEVEGLFSAHLARLKEGEKVKFYISKNRKFKLPEANKDVIMIGPGTGVAPFRSFLGHRNNEKGEGKNWLFFGERNFRSDFLYQTEMQDYLTSGVLTKFDVAFSRDQEEKIYVQDRIRESAQEFLRWIENGAYIYICGDKEKMAKDVEKAILEVIGDDYFQKLKNEDRYLLDVY